MTTHQRSSTDLPPFWTSPSFWVTLLPTVSAVVGYFLHQQIDLSSTAAAIGLVGGGISSGSLAIARSRHHAVVAQANMDLAHLAASEKFSSQPTSEEYVSHAHFQAVLSEVGADIEAVVQAVKKLQDQPAKKTVAKKTPANVKRRVTPYTKGHH